MKNTFKRVDPSILRERQIARDRSRSKNSIHNAGEFKTVKGVRVRVGDAPKITKTSEFSGVVYVSTKAKWQALFTDPGTGKDFSLGFFDDELCAASKFNNHVKKFLIANGGATNAPRLNRLKEHFDLRRSMNEGEERPCP